MGIFRDRYLIALALLTIVVFVIFLSHSNHKNAQGDLAFEGGLVDSRQVPTVNEFAIEAVKSPKESVSETEYEEVKSETNSNKPSFEELYEKSFSGYSLDRDNIVEQTRSLIAKFKKSKTGREAFVLNLIRNQCDLTPATQDELDDVLGYLEKNTLMLGQSNGDVTRRINLQQKKFDNCKQVRSLFASVGADNTDFLDVAIKQGSQRAKISKALTYTEQQLESMSSAELDSFRRSNGELLTQAKIECEPLAFKALASLNAHAHHRTWYIEDGSAESYQRAALENLLLYNTYYSNKTDGAEYHLSRVRFRVDKLIEQMSEPDVDEIYLIASDFYKNYCSEIRVVSSW